MTKSSPTTSPTTPHSPGITPDKDGVRLLYTTLREAFPDFRAGDRLADRSTSDLVTTYKVYYGTHLGPLLGVAPTGRAIHFETVDAFRVRDGKLTDYWGVANLLGLVTQLGAGAAARLRATRHQSRNIF